MFESIIFDLGGVIEKINPGQVAQEFRTLGMQDPEKFFSLPGQSDICSQLEIGKISENEFIEHLKSSCHAGTSSEKIIAAWCENLCGVAPETVTVLQKLKANGVRVFALSNTNIIHARKIENRFEKTYGINFHSLFEKIYYSFEVGFRKPQAEIYQHAIRDAKLISDNCIYVDDLTENLESPKKLGLRCVHHRTNAALDSSCAAYLKT